MFVQTWLKLQHTLKEKAWMAVLEPLTAEFMKKMISFGVGGDDPTIAESDAQAICLDYIQEGKQGKINGKGPELLVVSLNCMMKLLSCEIWLYAKYYGMILLDENPKGEGSDKLLESMDLWEEHKTFDMSWDKRKGWGVWTKLID